MWPAIGALLIGSNLGCTADDGASSTVVDSATTMPVRGTTTPMGGATIGPDELLDRLSTGFPTGMSPPRAIAAPVCGVADFPQPSTRFEVYPQFHVVVFDSLADADDYVRVLADAIAATAAEPASCRNVPPVAADDDVLVSDGSVDAAAGTGGSSVTLRYESESLRRGTTTVTAEVGRCGNVVVGGASGVNVARPPDAPSFADLLRLVCGDEPSEVTISSAAAVPQSPVSPTATTPSSAASSGEAISAGTSPEEQCLPDQVPQAAAYALADGTLRWVSCTTAAAFRSVRAVTDGAVYVTEASGDTVALDPVDGTPLATAPPAPVDEIARPRPGEPARIAVDEYEVTGGQDDSVTVYEGDGSVAWSKPGVWVYDDVWAIDDGAVFAVEREGPRLVAYELATGDVLWHVTGDPYGEGLWPWLAQDGLVITMWSNVQVRDSRSGELVWRTRYPRPANPNLRMAGAAMDDDTVYVGFASAPSGGD